MCVAHADPKFLKLVCDKLVKTLKFQLLAWQGRVASGDGAAAAHVNPFDVAFHGFLARYFKSWAELHTFVDGSTSAFHVAYEELGKAGVNFDIDVKPPVAAPPEKEEKHLVPANPKPRASPNPKPKHAPAHARPKENPAIVITEGTDLVLLAMQLPAETWTGDKEMVRQIYTRVKEVHKLMTRMISESEQIPEVDLGALLTLNTNLNVLETLIAKAAKGDQEAVAAISRLNNPNPLPDSKQRLRKRVRTAGREEGRGQGGCV